MDSELLASISAVGGQRMLPADHWMQFANAFAASRGDTCIKSKLKTLAF
ncbi:hypothetical protein RRSWK_01018 [Rhodopirellula sp. SWK7]|nr:hypothetical protein RRSWK_01018 [Rhodopirellula sp. SWK7]